MASMTRRDALRLLSLAAMATLGTACQISVPLAPIGTEAATRAPTPIPAPPTVAPTEVAAMPGIRLAIDFDPDTLDPAGQTNAMVSSIVDHLAETLVRLQPDGTIGPGLARKFAQSADGRTFTFELRPDVEFHDGSLLNAEAVSLSLHRFLNTQLRVPLRAPFDANLVDSIVPIDTLTLRITLKDSSRLFLQ
jgi:ABC-type transport system substrate-binding protein